MASDRTFVTELATGLACSAMTTWTPWCPGARRCCRQPVPAGLGSSWPICGPDHQYGVEFVDGFLNGQAFSPPPTHLNGRVPRIIEWTGGRRPPGDEVVPSDLRIDHVYLVSCKYLSGDPPQSEPGPSRRGAPQPGPGGRREGLV